MLKTLIILIVGAVVALLTDPTFAQSPAPPMAAAPTGASGISIDTSKIVNDIITYALLAFGAAIAGLITNVIIRLRTWLGVKTSEEQAKKIDRAVLNGLNFGAAKLRPTIDAQLPTIEVKNQVVAAAVQYVQDHTAETMKAMGLDPKDGKVVEAIQARIETAIADPSVPTPAEVTPEPKTPPIPVAATVTEK